MKTRLEQPGLAKINVPTRKRVTRIAYFRGGFGRSFDVNHYHQKWCESIPRHQFPRTSDMPATDLVRDYGVGIPAPVFNESKYPYT
jgi:hypothetical protein